MMMHPLLLDAHFGPAQLPELMLLDEDEDAATADNWMAGLACLSPPPPPAAAPMSAPLPISSHSRSPHMSPVSDLVDSMESSHSLLSASLTAYEAAHSPQVGTRYATSAPPQEQYSMRFVPVSVPPEQQVPYGAFAHTYGAEAPQAPQQQQLPWGSHQGLAGSLVGEHSLAVPSAQPPQPATYHPQPLPIPRLRPSQDVQYQAQYPVAEQQQYPMPQLQPSYEPALPGDAYGGSSSWEAAPALVNRGISSQEMQRGYSTQFGGQAPVSLPMRRVVSEDHLVLMRRQPGGQTGASRLLGAVAELGDSLGSEGSDEDTLAEHHHHLHSQPRHVSCPGSGSGLTASHSAPSFSLMALERTNSSRRSLHCGAATSGSRGGGATSASPRAICLKVKAPRAKPLPAAARAAAATAAASSPRPARASARRSVALSVAVAAADEGYASESEEEPEASEAAASEERRSSGAAAAATAASAKDGAVNGKKKHNPWSLVETEALVEGVRLLGPSKWAEIKKLGVSGIAGLLASRSAVDLKDKWRNLTRVAKLPKSALKARAHKNTSEIPLELLLTVKDLMEMSRE